MNLHDPRRLRDQQAKPRLMLHGNEGKTRRASLPDVPLLMELGYTDIEAVRSQFAVMGIEPTPSDATTLQKHCLQESPCGPRQIRERNISLD